MALIGIIQFIEGLLLALVTIFMIVSRIFLRRFMKNQNFRFRNSNPQVKNTVTFKTLTYEIFLLAILSTLVLLSEPNETHILVFVNLINILSNSFLLIYLFHNQEAIEYVKMKNCHDLKKFSKLFRRRGIVPQENKSGPIFTIRVPRKKELVKFSNDLELIDISTVSC